MISVNLSLAPLATVSSSEEEFSLPEEVKYGVEAVLWDTVPVPLSPDSRLPALPVKS